MSSTGTTQLDHAARVLSTAGSQSGEQANLVRFDRDALGEHASGPRRGHVESHFLKANSPDGARAIWVKHTLLIPVDPATPAVAEVWAIAFAERGARKLAQKSTFPLAQARLEQAPFRIALPSAELCTGHSFGSAGQGADQLGWDLRFDASQPAFLPFRHPRMYTGGFPRSKSLTPVPDTRMHGHVEAFGERWSVDGWRGAQGHNWGKSHAEAYAWLHCNELSSEPGGRPLDDTWVEALTGRVRVAGVTTPWLSVAGASLEGERLRFDGLSALLSRRVEISNDRYALTVEQAGVQLSFVVSAPALRFAGLRYQDPDGRSLTCLNTKLAEGTCELSVRGRKARFHTRQAALELGTRAPQNEVPVLA